jgi:hypothetical protein
VVSVRKANSEIAHRRRRRRNRDPSSSVLDTIRRWECVAHPFSDVRVICLASDGGGVCLAERADNTLAEV